MVTKDQIIEVHWFSNNTTQCFGCVAIRSHEDQWKAYINYVPGEDEGKDILLIANFGSKLNKRAALAMFPDLDPEQFVL